MFNSFALALLAGCFVSAMIGLYFNWFEFVAIAVAGGVLLVLASGFLLGRSEVEVLLQADPQRVTAGGAVAGQLVVRNPSDKGTRPLTIDVPVGAQTLRFQIGALAARGSTDEVFVVDTSRRAVIDVGPATTKRGDPLGLLSRDKYWTEKTEIFVRPPLIPLEALGAGLLRDLEGVASHDLSPSDLAFHALREYVPGDDLRHIHWRSTAKTGKYMVRQFLDTRRAHLALVTDTDLVAYRHEDEFELGMSVAASLAVRALADEYQVSLVGGDNVIVGDSTGRVLDVACRIEQSDSDLIATTLRVARQLSDCSLVFVITGPNAAFGSIQRAISVFAPEVKKFVLRIDPTHKTAVESHGAHTVLSLSRLEDLPMLLLWSVQ